MSAPEQQFTYRVREAGGKVQRGTLLARDLSDALTRLQQQGVMVLDLQPSADSGQAANSRSPARRGSIRAQERIVLLTEIAALLEAGVSLAEVVPSLEQAYHSTALGPHLTQLRQRLESGQRIGPALVECGIGLPDYSQALIEAGESAGRLAQAFADAAAQMEEEYKAGQDLKNALVYPAVLVGAGILSVTVIFVAVVPRFASLLKSGRAEVPAISRLVIQAGISLQQNWLQDLLAIMAAGGLLALVLSRPGARQGLLEFCHRLPLLGPWLHEREIGRWASLLATLLHNRVALLDALALSTRAVGLARLRQHLAAAQQELRRGRKLSDVLIEQGWIPELRINLVRVGERSGALAEMLGKLARMNTESAKARQKRLLTLIEPAAILLIGAVIGFIMVAVMLALSSLNSAKL